MGFEYPEIGIQVINAGRNKTENYKLNWNPKTKDEYDALIQNLERLHLPYDEQEVLEFYSMHFLIYDREYIPYGSTFFKEEYMGLDRPSLENENRPLGEDLYKIYIESFDWEEHNKIQKKIPELVNKMDVWDNKTLYKTQKFINMVNSDGREIT
jgi:hypothetical protein